MSIHLVRLVPDAKRLAAFAATRGALPRGGDLGYALHLALVAAFGAARPQPFRWIEPENRSGRTRTPQLLAYGADRETLREAADLPRAEPGHEHHRREAALALRLSDTLETKAMPQIWRAGARYGFEVRLRPVRRFGKTKRFPLDRGTAAEHDVYGVAMAAMKRTAGSEPLDPRTVYAEWAREQLQERGVAVERLGVLSLGRTPVVRGPVGSGRAKPFDGPDVTVGGTLRVADPAAFADLIARGLGRHRAFGFGMVLLKPAG